MSLNCPWMPTSKCSGWRYSLSSLWPFRFTEVPTIQAEVRRTLPCNGRTGTSKRMFEQKCILKTVEDDMKTAASGLSYSREDNHCNDET